MIPESMKKYFVQYNIPENDQKKFIDEFTKNGYLQIGGSAWGEPKPSVQVTVKTNVKVNEKPVEVEPVKTEIKK